MFFSYGEKEIAALKAKDKKLGAVIDIVGFVRREVDPDLFCAVVHQIVGQQISAKALETVWRRMTDFYGTPTPQAVNGTTLNELQAFGMSRRKAEYIKDFAAKVTSGEFDIETIKNLPDSDAITELTKLKGVGVWTAEMILLFCLQRADVLSYDDLAIRRGMRMVYRHREIPRPLFEKYRRRLSPFGSVASIYFWAVSGGAVPSLTDPAQKIIAKKIPKKAKNYEPKPKA